MKRKELYLLLISILSAASYSCTEQTVDPTAETCATSDSTIFINNELFEKYVFEYDSNNLLITVNADLGDNFHRIDHIENGRIVTKQYLLEDKILSTVNHTFHPNGRLKQIISDGLFINKETYYPDINKTENYGEDGLEESIKEERSNEVWETFYSYNSNNDLTKKLVNFNGFFSSVFDYTYDQNQNLTEITSQGTGARIFKEYFYYNSENQLVAKSMARTSQGPVSHGYVYDSTSYELNENGLKIKEVGIGEIYSGPNPSPSFKKFEYDSENRLIETLSSYNDADYYTTLTLKYHSNGNLQERITYDRNSNITWQETYDIDGRPLQINDKFYTYQQNEICF